MDIQVSQTPLRAVSLVSVSRFTSGLSFGAAQPWEAQHIYTKKRHAASFLFTDDKFTYGFTNSQYGDANNSSRPGNALTSVAFTSNSGNTTLRLVADNSTTSSVASIVGTNCSSLIAGSQIVVAVGSSSNSSNISFTTLPEQAVQYYRASSIVLTLDGYNDTDAVQASLSTHVPIPNWVNQTMLQCVNQTIGAAAPLIDAGTSTATGLSLPNSAMSTTSISLEFGLQTGGMGLVCLTWIIGYMLSRVL